MKVRYLISYESLPGEPWNNMSERHTVLLDASDDADARRQFNAFCKKYPTHLRGETIIRDRCLIREAVLARE